MSESVKPWDHAALAATPERRAVMMKAAGVPVDRFTTLHLAFSDVFRRVGIQTKKAGRQLIADIRQKGHPVGKDPLIEIVAAALWYCRDTEIKHPTAMMISNGVHATPRMYLEKVQETLGAIRLTHTPLANPKPGEQFLTGDRIRQAATDTLAMLAGTKPFPVARADRA